MDQQPDQQPGSKPQPIPFKAFAIFIALVIGGFVLYSLTRNSGGLGGGGGSHSVTY